MNSIYRVALIGVAMNDNGRSYAYPAIVRRHINDDAAMEYPHAADFLNDGDFQVLSVFLDQFIDQATLIDFITMCYVYVTPYLNESQMTSGTLASGFTSPRASVVSYLPALIELRSLAAEMSDSPASSLLAQGLCA